MQSLLDPLLAKAYAADRLQLSQTKVPIITVSATFQEDIKRFHRFPHNNTDTDVVLSRAHFSMALGIAQHLWGDHLDPRKAWLADPTNYVSAQDWQRIVFTETVGKILARWPVLKTIKDIIDRFGRSKLPISTSIVPPLLYLTELVDRPILSLHIAAGNVLAEQGKKVIQVVTDPHVRPEYVQHANLMRTRYCVFDEGTKLEFLHVAAELGVHVHHDHVIVTGPPIDPRIVRTRARKSAWRSGPLRLCLATGGLGTNKAELRKVLQQLLPCLRHRPSPYQLLVYCGTHADIAQMVRDLAKEARIGISPLHDRSAPLRILYHPQILDANEMLISYGFPWAHGFITKPSGDMAYDAVAAGCFLLTLQEWGVWEERIRMIFEKKEIAKRADVDHIFDQIQFLQDASFGTSWIERAMNHALGIEKLFLHGGEHIAKLAQQGESLFEK